MGHRSRLASYSLVALIAAGCGKPAAPPAGGAATGAGALATTAPATTAPATTAPPEATKAPDPPATAAAPDAQAGAEDVPMEGDPTATDKVQAVTLGDGDLEQVALPGETRRVIGWRDRNGTNAVVIKRESPKALLTATHLIREGDGSWTTKRDFKELVSECGDYRLTLEAQTGAWSVSDLDADGIGEATWAWSAGCRTDWSPVTHKVLLTESGEKYVLRGTTATRGTGGDFKTDADFEKAPAAFRAHAETVWKATATERPPQRADYASEAHWGNDFLGWERLGPVPVGGVLTAIEPALGKPESKDEVFHDVDASGDYYQRWHYPARGFDLTVHSAKDPKLADGALSSIRAGAGSTLETRLGIRVGSSEADMRTAYTPYMNKEMSRGPYLAIGIEWSWLTFEARDGKVVGIAFGLGQDPPDAK